jgi:hypothetical protein
VTEITARYVREMYGLGMHLWHIDQFPAGSAESDAALHALWRSWDRRAGRVHAALQADDPDLGKHSSVLAKIIRGSTDFPGGLTRAAVYSQPTTEEDVLRIGVRVTPVADAHAQAVNVAIADLVGNEYVPVDIDYTGGNAALVGALIIGNVRWGELHGVPLLPDCSGIMLPTPVEPAGTNEP